MPVTFIQSGRFSVAFSPDDIAGLRVWWDASDSATITKDGSNLVSAWNDKSGNGHHLAVAGSEHPTWVSAAKNGLDAVQFIGDGANGDYLTHDAGSDAIDLSPLTVFIVCVLDATQSSSARILSARQSATLTNDFASPNLIVSRVGGGDNIDAYIDGVNQTATRSYTDDTWIIYECRADGSSTMGHRINGGTESTKSSASVPGNLRYLRLGQACVTSGNPPGVSGNEDLYGKIGEVIIYNAALDATQRTTVRDYLNAKWAVY